MTPTAPGPAAATALEAWFLRRAGAADPRAPRPTAADVERHQLRLLQETVAWARARSPHYREVLAGVDPGALDGRARVASLPFTTATDLRERGARLLCVSQDEIARVVTLTTSGTTGAPKRLHFTEEDHARTVAFFEAGLASAGVGAGDAVLVLMPGVTPGSAGALVARAAEGIGALPVQHGFVEDLREALAVAERVRPAAVVGVPVQVLALARHAEEVVRRPLPLRSAILCSDHVASSLVRSVEQACGCRVFEYFGMTELGLGGGIQCSAHDGTHLQEADFLFEIVDPATGRVLEDGCRGELVVTTLARRGMPLVRYRTGDLTCLLPGRCRCGAALRRLARVTGRWGARGVPGAEPLVTLADLDEALLGLDGIVDFTAAVSDDRRPSTLSLTVHTVSAIEGGLARSVRAALDGVAGLRRARDAGALTVELAALRLDGRLVRAPGKRVLRGPGEG